MPVQVNIPELGDKFKDYRDGIQGDSFSWGPTINTNDIKYFTFHHSVTPQTAKTDRNWKAECDRIAQNHIAQGWNGVGYRFIICSDGTVAYVGDLGRGGSAVADHNHEMFSACLVGDFTKELPTATQIHSAHVLAKFFLLEMPQYPNLDNWEDIKGHQEFNLTACPGHTWLEASGLRDRIIHDLWQGYPDPQPIPNAPQPVPEPPQIDWKKKYDDMVVSYGSLQKDYNDLVKVADSDHNLIIDTKKTIYGKWTWIGVNGWRNRLNQLKLTLPNI